VDTVFYWISATFKGQDYWVQRQIDPARPISKHAFARTSAFFDEGSVRVVMQWLRTMGATDVHCWPAGSPHVALVEGEHWFTEFVSGVGLVIAVQVQTEEGLC